MNMMDIRRRMLEAAYGLHVMSVSTMVHTATDLSSISWDDLKIYADLIAADTSHTYTNDTKSVAFSDGQRLSIGDVKSVMLNGTVGYFTFSNYTTYCCILGFRHNFGIEETGIHFQFGKTGLGGTDVAFVDSRYDDDGAGFRMAIALNYVSVWESSYMRNTIIPAFYNAVPSSLQNVIAKMKKYAWSNGVHAMTYANDNFSLLAEFEIFGTRTRASIEEQNYQQQYAYYAAGNSKIKYKHNATGTACVWWMRSPIPGNGSSNYLNVSDTASVQSGSPTYSYGFAPIFSIGTAE